METPQNGCVASHLDPPLLAPSLGLDEAKRSAAAPTVATRSPTPEPSWDPRYCAADVGGPAITSKRDHLMSLRARRAGETRLAPTRPANPKYRRTAAVRPDGRFAASSDLRAGAAVNVGCRACRLPTPRGLGALVRRANSSVHFLILSVRPGWSRFSSGGPNSMLLGMEIAQRWIEAQCRSGGITLPEPELVPVRV